MIASIIEAVASLTKAPIIELSYALLNGGVYRDRLAYRNILLIYRTGKPWCVAKWSISSAGSAHEATILQELNAAHVRSPKQLGILHIGDIVVGVEEFLDGMSLHELLTRRLISVETALTHARDLFDHLQRQTSTSSSTSALTDELQQLFAQVSATELFAEIAPELPNLLLTKIQAAFSTNPTTSVVHFDFILRNIALVGETPFVFDCEFSARSHFAACDWLRLFMYSPALTHYLFHRPGEIDSMFERREMPESVRALLNDRDISPYLLVLTYLFDFRAKLSVCPRYLRASLREAFHNRLRDLHAVLPGIRGVADVIPIGEAQKRRDIEQTKSSESFLSERQQLLAEFAMDRKQQELEYNIRTLKSLIEIRNKDIVKRDDNIQALHGVIHHKDLEITHRDTVIESLVASPAFRIGKVVTGVAKKIPGAQRFRPREQ